MMFIIYMIYKAVYYNIVFIIWFNEEIFFYGLFYGLECVKIFLT